MAIINYLSAKEHEIFIRKQNKSNKKKKDLVNQRLREDQYDGTVMKYHVIFCITGNKICITTSIKKIYKYSMLGKELPLLSYPLSGLCDLSHVVHELEASIEGQPYHPRILC